MEIPDPWGASVAANITPTNLADWSDAAIKQAITTGVRADGTRLLPPMGFGYYKNISASDLDALAAYLRSLPAREGRGCKEQPPSLPTGSRTPSGFFLSASADRCRCHRWQAEGRYLKAIHIAAIFGGMTPPKLHLPPFAALRAFHAAAIHGRLRDAAESLGVTESAISHQIRRLEDFLHTALFDRSGPGLRLTPAGRRYLDDIDPAIRQIQSATDALLGPSGRRVVRLTLAPSLALNWLIPRLGAFEREHPDIELQLVTTTRVLDLQRDQIDLALRHGKGAWSGVKSTFLLAETVVPVCAPGYLTWQPEEDPLAALRRARLLVSARSPDEWEEWARARGLTAPSLAGALELEGEEQVLQVAEGGHGLGIGRRPVVDDRLARGVLVAPFGTDDPSGAAHYLCQPADVPPTAAARQVARWLHKLAAAT